MNFYVEFPPSPKRKRKKVRSGLISSFTECVKNVMPFKNAVNFVKSGKKMLQTNNDVFTAKP